jgi:hypothetical protein
MESSFTYFHLRNKNSPQKKEKRKEEWKRKRSNRSAATPIPQLAGQAKLEFSTSSVRERAPTDNRRRDFLQDFGFVGN